MRLVTVLFVAFALLAAAKLAWGCALRDQNVKALWQMYGERREAWGLSGDGKLIELYVNEKSHTFTIITTAPESRGVSCLLVEGATWTRDRGESR